MHFTCMGAALTHKSQLVDPSCAEKRENIVCGFLSLCFKLLELLPKGQQLFRFLLNNEQQKLHCFFCYCSLSVNTAK